MSREEKRSNDRPESYPKPNETDTQLKNQDEFSTLNAGKVGNPQETSVPTPKEDQPSTNNTSIEGS